MRTTEVTPESTSCETHVSREVLVSMVIGHSFLRCANIDLVILVLEDRLHNTCAHPGARAEADELEEEGNDQQDVSKGIVEEGDGEGGSRKLPRDRGKDGGDDGTLETIVQELLGTV